MKKVFFLKKKKFNFKKNCKNFSFFFKVLLDNSLKYRGIFCTIDFVKEYANSIAELIKDEYID